MKTIIAGSRGLGYVEVVNAMELCRWTPSVVISGGARGVDQAGERWAKEHHIPIQIYPTLEKMAENADALVAVWDGYSSGTKHMIKIAKDFGLRTYVWFLPQEG